MHKEPIATEPVTLACGHEGRLMLYAEDKPEYVAARRLRMQTKKRCLLCAQKKHAEDNARSREANLAKRKLTKDTAMKRVGPGVIFNIQKRQDGRWEGGALSTFPKIAVTAESGGAMGLISKLALLWCREFEANLVPAEKHDE